MVSNLNLAEKPAKNVVQITTQGQSKKTKAVHDTSFYGLNEADGNLMANISHLASALAKNNGNYANNIQKPSIVPFKPIPQRQNGTGMNLLYNACKISEGNLNLDESAKKRNDKALDKSMHEILSNETSNMLGVNTPGSLGNMQTAITALLNMRKDQLPFVDNPNLSLKLNNAQSVGDRRSSSENEDSSKLRTPSKKHCMRVENGSSSKAKTKRVYPDAYGNSDIKAKRITYSDTKGNYSLYRSGDKRDLKKSFVDDEVFVSRVKQTVRNGGITQLVLERKQDEVYDPVINIATPQRKLWSTFKDQGTTSNLNSIIAKLGGESQPSGSIADKIKHLMSEKLGKQVGEYSKRGGDIFSNDPKINSLPLLFSNGHK
jgi:hypothetical protein